MIFERPVLVSSQVCVVLCARFAFILEPEDSSDNDAGQVSTRKGTVTADRDEAHRPEDGTNHLADPKGNHASIHDRIEREDDGPFSVSNLDHVSNRIVRADCRPWTPIVERNIVIVVRGAVAQFDCLRPHVRIKSKENRCDDN